MEQAAVLAAANRARAYERLVSRFSSVFPRVQVDRGLLATAVTPSNARHTGGFAAYFEALNRACPVSVFGALWPIVFQHQVIPFFVEVVRLGPALPSQGGINNIRVYPVRLVDADMVALTHGSTLAVMKEQRMTTVRSGMSQASLSFLNEVVVSRLLNTLVTAFESTATPHFAFFLGTFRAGYRLVAFYEHGGDMTMAQLLADPATPIARWKVLIFQVLFSIAVASFSLGYAHNDLHLNNVMVRSTVGTTYEGKTLVYKCRNQGDSEYVRFPASVHGNLMAVIIDQGMATVDPVCPADGAGSSWAWNFARDARRFLGGIMEVGQKNSPLIQAHRSLFDRIGVAHAQLPDYYTGSFSEAAHGRARLFAAQWWQRAAAVLPAGDPNTSLSFLSAEDEELDEWSELGLGDIWGDIVTTGAGAGATSDLLVGLAPKDAVISRPDVGGDGIVPALNKIWNPKQGMKRTRAGVGK